MKMDDLGVCKEAQRVIRSNDLVAIENLKVRNMVKNQNLAKLISDGMVQVSRVVRVFGRCLWCSGKL